MPRSNTKSLDPKPLFKVKQQPTHIYMSNRLGDLGSLVTIEKAEKRIAASRGVSFKWMENICSAFQKADFNQPADKNLELYFNNLSYVYQRFVITQVDKNRQVVVARMDLNVNKRQPPVMVALYCGENKTIVRTPDGKADSKNNADLIGDEYISTFPSSEKDVSSICTSAKHYGNHAGIFEYAPTEEELADSFLDAEQLQKAAHRNVISSFAMHYGIPCRLVVTVETIKTGEGFFLDYGADHIAKDLNREFYLYDKQCNILIKNARLYLQKKQKIAHLKQAIADKDLNNIFGCLQRSHKNILNELNSAERQALKDVTLELHCYALFSIGLSKLQQENTDLLKRDFFETENALYVLFPYLTTIRDHALSQNKSSFEFFQPLETTSSLKQEMKSESDYLTVMQTLDEKAIKALQTIITQKNKLSKEEFKLAVNNQLNYWQARKTYIGFDQSLENMLNYYWHTGLAYREMIQADKGMESLEAYINLVETNSEKLSSPSSKLVEAKLKLIECRILKAEILVREGYLKNIQPDSPRINLEKFTANLPKVLQLIGFGSVDWGKFSNSILLCLCAVNYHLMEYYLFGDEHEIKLTTSTENLELAFSCLNECRIFIKAEQSQSYIKHHTVLRDNIMVSCLTAAQFINEHLPNKKELHIKYLEALKELMEHFAIKKIELDSKKYSYQQIENQLADLKGYENQPAYCSIS